MRPPFLQAQRSQDKDFWKSSENHLIGCEFDNRHSPTVPLVGFWLGTNKLFRRGGKEPRKGCNLILLILIISECVSFLDLSNHRLINKM